MSVINRALRDLDARHAALPENTSPRAPVGMAATPRWRVAASFGGGALAVILVFSGIRAWHAPEPSVPRPMGATQPAGHVPVVPRFHESAPASVPPAPAAAVPKEPLSPIVAAAKEPAVSVAEGASALQPNLGMDLSEKVARVREGAPMLPLSPTGIQKTAIAPSPDEDAAARYRKALVAVDKGSMRQARALLDETLALSPGHVDARQLLVTLLNGAGQSQEAESVLRAGLAASPTHAWFPLALARLQAARGEEDVAAATLTDGLERLAPDGEYHATLAALHLRLKRPAEAAAQYKLALKSRSDQGSWWLGLALALEGQGAMDDAETAYARALAAGNLPERLVEFAQKRITH